MHTSDACHVSRWPHITELITPRPCFQNTFKKGGQWNCNDMPFVAGLLALDVDAGNFTGDDVKMRSKRLCVFV